MYVKKNKTVKRKYRRPLRKGYSLVKRLNRLSKKVDGEKKWISLVPQQIGISTTPTAAFHLTAVNTGSENYQRNAYRIRVPYISYRCTYDAHLTQEGQLRQVIVQDLQQIGDTSPGWLDVFETNSFNTLINPYTKGRFKIIRDTVITFDQAKQVYVHRKGILKVNSRIQYNGQNSGDIQKNGIYVFWVSDRNALENPPILIDCHFRPYFYDN